MYIIKHRSGNICIFSHYSLVHKADYTDQIKMGRSLFKVIKTMTVR